MAESPSSRTMKLMRSQGYLCAVVEKWIEARKIRQDLYGYIDILAIKGAETIGIQATASGVSARLEKILNHENLVPWLEGDSRQLEIHGWRKLKKKVDGKTWVPRIIDVWMDYAGEIHHRERGKEVKVE